VYRDDVAHIHHEGFSEFARSAAPGVVDLLRRAGIERGRIIEVGCGSGVLASELTRAGYDVLGFDASAAMIDLARVTAPNARFAVARFEDAPLEPCEAIVAMGEVLNYGDARAFLPRAARAARFLLFDIAEKGSYPAYDERRIGGDDWSVIALKESDGSRLTRRVLTFRQIGDETRRDEEVHHLELYDRDEILALLHGFRVRVRRSYGRRRLPKGHAVYVASR
jgi:SAM-dependent methyltransferase